MRPQLPGIPLSQRGTEGVESGRRDRGAAECCRGLGCPQNSLLFIYPPRMGARGLIPLGQPEIISIGEKEGSQLLIGGEEVEL